MSQIINDPRSRMIRGEITPLKYYLGEHKMTVKDLADKTGLNKRNLDDYVSGCKDIHGIAFASGLSIARTLEIDPWDLFPRIYDNTKEDI
ncbi:MAG: helix-turn-helix transcriptional regulator [Parabacteroides sp.]|nr:helix-turn-helix transcriptional regulator [Parabacteroides sp.]